MPRQLFSPRNRPRAVRPVAQPVLPRPAVTSSGYMFIQHEAENFVRETADSRLSRSTRPRRLC